jgi:HAD superfamily hydrolase (TIGR01509 family)
VPIAPLTSLETAYEAVIFDFDGTLVDTMGLHYEAYRAVFAELRLTLSRTEFDEAIGGKAAETIPRLLKGRAAAVSIDEIHRRKKAHVKELLATGPVPLLETAHLLPLFQARIRMALASSGSREGIEVLLARFDWARFFEVVVTGEDVALGKPSPELFLLAAQRLGVPAARCFVFEDTDAGIAAARAAGMGSFDVRAAAGNRT